MRPKFALSATKLILALAVFTHVFGQSALPGMSKRGSGVAGGSGSVDFNLTQPLSSHLSSPAPQFGMILPSDNSIDENEYMIGSGDVFFIVAVESPSIRYTAAVDQSGRAFIQNVGLVEVGKTSYAKAKKNIAEHVSANLRNPSEIYVTLFQTKSATVSFTGAIRSPGSYVFPGTTRLLDAIRAANNDSLPLASSANLRQIACTSGDSTVIYDLMAHLHNGDKSQNPYIYPGDRIRINPTTNSVFISGAIKTPAPGFYPLKTDETIGEFLSMFTLDNTADTNNIIIFQPSDNSKVTLKASDRSHVLNNMDAITVPVRKNHNKTHTVFIFGEIASPGHYPIIENNTSARQIIDMAGGMKETGNIDQIAVIRPIKNLPDRLNAGVHQMSMVRPERSASISMASASQDYTIIKLIHYNAEKVMLEPGDQIVIPKKDRFVYISGNVRSPGAYPFLPGRDSNYYIAQAGGYSRSADRYNVQVFVKYGDLVQSVEPRCIEPGSVIVVPASIQYKFLSQVVLPLASVILSSVSLGLSIYSVSK